ncbi:MAG: hypothetical protein ACKO15_09405, partial [Burkholderiales bacterium]
AAKRIFKTLENATLGLSIGENTGLTGAKVREVAIINCLLIASSLTFAPVSPVFSPILKPKVAFSKVLNMR